MRDLERVDESRLVDRWSSSQDYIRAQINGRTKRISEFSHKLIRPLKVRPRKMIASFESKANNNQPHPITIYHDKHVIK